MAVTFSLPWDPRPLFLIWRAALKRRCPAPLQMFFSLLCQCKEKAAGKARRFNDWSYRSIIYAPLNAGSRSFYICSKKTYEQALSLSQEWQSVFKDSGLFCGFSHLYSCNTQLSNRILFVLFYSFILRKIKKNYICDCYLSIYSIHLYIYIHISIFAVEGLFLLFQMCLCIKISHVTPARGPSSNA